MDIGSAIAVFLVLSILLMALFCFVTKYFHYKMKRALQEANQVYSMVDQLCNQSENQIQADYDDYIINLKEIQNKSAKKKKKGDKQVEIEMGDIKTPFNKGQDIYGPSALRRRLNQEVIPIKQESNRSMSSLKSFRPEKLMASNRTDVQSKGGDQTKREVTKHTYVNKLVCYDSQGLTTIDVVVYSLRKIASGVIKQKQKVKVAFLSLDDQNFKDQLEIVGFEPNNYGCYKYETTVEVSNMKTNEDYMIKSLKTSESKQEIEVDQYMRLRKNYDQGI